MMIEMMLFQMGMAVLMNLVQGLALGLGFAVGQHVMKKRLK